MMSTWFSPPEIAVRNARLIVFLLALVPLWFPGPATEHEMEDTLFTASQAGECCWQPAPDNHEGG